MNGATSDRAIRGTLILAIGLIVAPHRAVGQTTDAPPEHSYQLIYAPLEKIAGMAQDELRTMRRERFFSLIETVLRPTPPDRSGDAFLQRATYRARLENRQLVDGSAILEIVSSQDRLVQLPIGPVNLAIRSPRWQRPTAAPAVFGAEPDGRFVLVAPSSGALHFDWSRSAEPADADDLTFHLRLPSCPVNRLELVLPAEFTLRTSHGVPVRTDLDLPEVRNGSPAGEALWQIEIGGNCDLKLGIRRAATDVPPVQLRQANTYTISEYGVELTADLRLDSGGEAIRQLEVLVDKELRLVRAQAGTQMLSWSVVSSPDGQPTSILIEIDQPLQGTNRAVSLSAIAPISLVGSHSLPRLRPQSVDWQQETARIYIERPLAPIELVLEQARQLPFEEGDQAGQPAPLDIQFLEPEGNIVLKVDSLLAKYSFNSGISVVVSGDQAIADVRLGVRTDSDQLFEIEADIDEGWVIESVESTQGDLIHDWKIEAGNQGGRLKISFRQPLSIGAETILTLRARRRWSQIEKPIAQSQLRPLRVIGNAIPVREFLVIHPDDEHVVEFRGDRRVTWLTLDDLDATEAQLTDASETDPIVLLDGNEKELAVGLSQVPQAERPFAASVQITSLVTAPVVHEKLRIEIDRLPPSPTLRIRLNCRQESAIRWFSASDPQRSLSARREPLPGDKGEVWLVDNPESANLPIVIMGERYFPPADQLRLTLAQVEGAKIQEGAVLIEASADLDLEVRHSQLLAPSPLYRQGFRNVSRMRKAFRYDPTADIFADPNPLVVSILPGSDRRGRTHVWDATLETHLDQSGIARCQLSLRVEDHGGAELAFQLESDWTVRELLVDNRAATVSVSADNQLLIPLPATQRFSFVQINFDIAGHPLRFWQRVPAVRPRLNVPVLSERRLVWTPPEFAIGRAAPREQGPIRDCLRRLLGPILRPAETEPFPLFSQNAWRNLATASTSASDWHPATIVWLERLGGISNGTWNTAVSDTPGDMRLWIDATRLANCGVSPNSRIPVSDIRNRRQKGLDRLQKAGLILVEADDGLVLTTSEYIAQVAPHQEIDHSSVVLRRAELSINGRNPFATGPGWGLVNAAMWNQLPDIWTNPRRDSGPFAAGGWRLHVDSGRNAKPLLVYRRATFLIAGCVAFLLTLSAVWLIRYRSLKLALAGVVTSAIFALVLPVPLSWIGLGAFWGSLAALILSPFPTQPQTDEPRSQITLVRMASLMGLVLTMVIATWPTSIFGQDSDANGIDRQDHSAPHRVYIPADEHGVPIGDHLFVPAAFQQILTEHAERIEGHASDWVFESAIYRGTLMRQEGSTTPRIDSILAEYRLHVTALRSPVQLQIPRESAALLEREARLNGRPIRLEWNTNQSALLLPIRDHGSYELELTYRLRQQGAQTSIDLKIPPVPQSVFLLSSQEDVTPVTVRSARGAVRKDESANELRADLGPTDRLHVHWGGSESADTGLLEQLSWLRIQPDRVFLNVRLVIDPARWQLPSLRVKVDDRLQLDPQSSDQPVTVIPSEQAGARILDFAYDPNGDPAVYDLNFIVVGWSGVGRIRLPRFQVLDVDTVGHDLAVSTAPQLEIHPGTLAGADLQPAEQFAAKWGSDQTPDYAFRLEGQDPGWTCTTTLVESPTQADIQVAYVISREATRVILLANLTTHEGHYQLKLKVPDNVEIEKILQIDGSAERELRWAQTGPREVNVFFDPPRASSFQLAILGRQDQLGIGVRRLPSIRLLDCTSNGEQLLVFRRSDVILDSDSAPTQLEAPTQIDSFITSQLGLARWYATFDLVGEEEAPPLNVQSNDRQMTAHLTNVVTRSDGIWQLHIDVEYQIERGVLDAVRFEIPETWMARLRDSLDVRVEFGKSPRPELVRVTIWPKDPFDPNRPMKFAGPIPIKPGEPLQIPNIRLLEDAVVERTLYLPVEIDATPVLWRTRNLQPQAFDPAEISTPTANTRLACYKIVSDDFQAIRLPTRTARQRPQIHLTDVRIAWNSSTSYHGQVSYDLLPSGISDCRIRFPRGLQPIGVAVENTVVDFRPEEAAKGIRVELESNELPQRICVLFVGETMTGMPDSVVRIQIPRIERMDVSAGDSREVDTARTLWTIHSPRDASVDLRIDTASLRSAADLELTRLTSLASLFDLAGQMTTDFIPGELQRWYELWGERFNASLRRGQSIQDTSETARSQHAMTLTELNKSHAEVVDRLMVSEIHQRLANQRSVDSIDIWRKATPADLHTQFAAFDGSMSFINAHYHSIARDSLMIRSIVALFVGLAGLGSIVVLNRNQIENVRWVHVFGVLAGLTWWLWLQPSIVGLVIVVVTLLSMSLTRRPAVRL